MVRTPSHRAGPAGIGPSGSELTNPNPQATVVASAVTPAAGPSASASAVPAPPAPVEIRNDCPDSLQLFVGEQPSFSSGSALRAPGRTVTPAPRAADGSLTIWILDGKGAGVTKAQALAASKRITIQIDCRTMHVE